MKNKYGKLLISIVICIKSDIFDFYQLMITTNITLIIRR